MGTIVVNDTKCIEFNVLPINAEPCHIQVDGFCVCLSGTNLDTNDSILIHGKAVICGAGSNLTGIIGVQDRQRKVTIIRTSPAPVDMEERVGSSEAIQHKGMSATC